MQRFKNILLVMDPEVEGKAALDKAVLLAQENDARLTLFSVVHDNIDLTSIADFVMETPPLDFVSERQQWLESFIPARQGNGIDIVAVVATGIHFLEIIRQVLRKEYDLVITTAEESEGIRARVFGTTSMHLMRKCPCPVWVVKKAQTQPFTRIMAAVDPAPYDSKQDSLNPLILELASSLARKEAAELHIVHAWNLFGESYLHNYGMTEKDIQQAKEQEEVRHKQNLDTLLGRADIIDLKPYLHMVEGKPDKRIPELVVEQDIDLLIMGTVCRTGIAGFLIGNIAEEVLSQVDCSLLTLKPECFVTPVTLE